MREIKFRAWDKEKQFIFTPTEIEITQGENFDKWDEWRPMAWRDELPEEGSGGIGRALGDECELMQFTGVKDKNGKDIFEGDIVRISGYPFQGSIDIDGNYEVGYNEYMELCCGNLLLFRTRNYAEVIGNIYEIPELLGN
ncbi:hypothetical protein CN526_26885 [Bacillus wiedmannii]|uniref:YopX family protein n=1 Tax=Bacillus wiedmannii TaxID=1890302 RepID=UPI000BF4758F|nr:YopX family protein [Bacillus wiedmannii]PEU21542.1 hypothetical protein CN526_26885 [Bacillus wiedmannii]